MDVVMAEPDFVRFEAAAQGGFQEGAAQRLLDMAIVFSNDPATPKEFVSSVMLRCLPSLSRWIQWNINRRSFFHDQDGRMHLAVEDYGPDEALAFRHLLRCLHFTSDGPLLAYLRERVLPSGYILHLIVMANKWLHHELVEQAQGVLIEFIVDTFLCGTNDPSEALQALAFCDEVELSKSDLAGIVRAGTFGLRALSAQALERIDGALLARLPSDVLLHLIAFSGDPRKALRFANAGLERIARVIAPRCLSQQQMSRWKRHPSDMHLSNLYVTHASGGKTREANLAALVQALQELWMSERSMSMHRSHSQPEPEDRLATAATLLPTDLRLSEFDECRVLRLVRVGDGHFMPHERFIVDGVEYFLRLAAGGTELSLEVLHVAARAGAPKRLDVFVSLDMDPRLERNVNVPRLVLKFHKQTPLPRADCEVLARYPINREAAASLGEVACVVRVQGSILQTTRPRSWPSSASDNNNNNNNTRFIH